MILWLAACTVVVDFTDPVVEPLEQTGDTGQVHPTGDTDIPDTDVPDTDIPDTDIPDTDIPDTDVPDLFEGLGTGPLATNGEWIVAGGPETGTVWVFDETLVLIARLIGPEGFGASVAIAENPAVPARIVVGSPGEDRVYVLDAEDGEASAALTTITGQAGSRFGASVAAGDFDGDGAYEIAVGAPEHAGGSGIVALFQDALGPVLLEAGQAIEGEESLGVAVAFGSVNPDDAVDLVACSTSVCGVVLGTELELPGSLGDAAETLLVVAVRDRPDAVGVGPESSVWVASPDRVRGFDPLEGPLAWVNYEVPEPALAAGGAVAIGGTGVWCVGAIGPLGAPDLPGSPSWLVTREDEVLIAEGQGLTVLGSCL